jgi:molybdate transport system substrate-binding protein
MQSHVVTRALQRGERGEWSDNFLPRAALRGARWLDRRLTKMETAMFRTMRAALLLLALVVACKGAREGEGGPLLVAAAADLHFAFKEMGERFEKKTGKKVTFSFGSTGLLAKQISEGGPFDVFAAANVSFVDDVVKSGACFADTKTTYARGRIVVWTTKDKTPPALEALGDGAMGRVAIANPEHAPYGRAAREALMKAGVWEKVKTKTVYGDNIQQTLQFAQSGNVDVSIVALSLATVSEGSFTPIDPAMHEPIDQALVVCKGQGEGTRATAREFTAFVGSEEGRAIMKRYGFLLPSEKLDNPR